MDPTSLQAYALAPISRLPAEILLEIFDSVTEDCETIMKWYQQITHVCRYWRQLAITTAKLWTNIPVNLDDPYLMHIALERSKSAMLNLNLWLTPRRTSSSVLKHIARVQDLSILNNVEELDFISSILSVVEDDAKELTRLTIHNSCRTKRLYKLPDSFSAATKLKCLSLENIEIDWKSPLLMAQNLTSLTLESTLRPERVPSWEDLLGVLARLPRLSVLGLSHVWPSAPPSVNIPTVHLSQLRYSFITCNKPFKIGSFLSQVTFPPLNLLYVTCSKAQQDEDTYASIIQDVIRNAPASFASDSIRLIIDGFLRRCITLTLHQHHNNNLGARLQHRIRFAFAYKIESHFEAIVRGAMIPLRLNTTLQSLDLRLRGPRVPEGGTINPQELVRLFGSIAKLSVIRARGSYCNDMVVALGISLSDPPVPIPSFPHLETIELLRANFEDQRNVEQFEDALIHRYENGVGIKALKFFECRGLDPFIIKRIERFTDIVVDVPWVEDCDWPLFD